MARAKRARDPNDDLDLHEYLALKSEIEAAGFKLVDEGDFLRSPNDTHDFIIFNSKIPIDVFVIKFQKPH